MSEASITVIVTKEKDSIFGGLMGTGVMGPSPMMASGRPYTAMVASNPQMRCGGDSPEHALDGLKHIIKSHMSGTLVKVVDMSLDELIVEEIMGS